MLAVVVRTVRLLAIGTVLALLDLEKVRMVFLLLPAVRVRTLILVLTALRVATNEVVHLPIGTHFALIGELRRPPTKVLPVVSINTRLSIVIILSIGTPHGLKVEHVEVHINDILLNEFN